MTQFYDAHGDVVAALDDDRLVIVQGHVAIQMSDDNAIGLFRWLGREIGLQDAELDEKIDRLKKRTVSIIGGIPSWA